ncbi:MAG: hypothetical protein L3J69_14275 [Desulfobacula sp.]|nr:hypothetical protein [Desulfobacula sp.]
MKKNEHTVDIVLTGPQTNVVIHHHPSMAGVFLKAFFIAPFRSNIIKENQVVKKTQIVLNQYKPDQDQIASYCKVCGFEQKQIKTIPISFLQTLFIGILGKFITSSFFPFNPLGLIQIFQSFELKRKVLMDEVLDLSCTLDCIKKTSKGFETDFILQVRSGEQIVWQGISRYLSRKKTITENKKRQDKKEDVFLNIQETIEIPADTGRKYARVSGDFNPHHLYPVLAGLFGFKTAIAHGMWSLARVIASLDKKFDLQDGAHVEAAFKLPVFMPATTTLGFESDNGDDNDKTIILFELRDKKKGLPHLKGQLFKNDRL